jgi:hypothetical protein
MEIKMLYISMYRWDDNPVDPSEILCDMDWNDGVTYQV